MSEIRNPQWFKPGNQCALKHGKRTREAILARKANVATVKAAGLLLARIGAVKGRVRRAPLRPDQVMLLPDAWQAWFPGAALTAPANFLDQKPPCPLVVKA
ncbi:MAG: hypothetical protein ING10_05705 [Roseomonas sp.]|nr:hypothetical protein [Roseomonas sp.]